MSFQRGVPPVNTPGANGARTSNRPGTPTHPSAIHQHVRDFHGAMYFQRGVPPVYSPGAK